GYRRHRALPSFPTRRSSDLDLAQNFEFCVADFELDELRRIVEQTMREIPAHRVPIWFGSNHDHSRMATRWGKGDERRHRAALFLDRKSTRLNSSHRTISYAV